MQLGDVPTASDDVAHNGKGGTKGVIAVGIDIGKRQHEACFMDEAGHEIGPSLRFAHRRGGVRLLQERLDALPESATVALEASGHYWIGLERWLRKGGIPVQVVNPLQVHAFREAGIRRTKTDRRDAWVLADLLRIGRTRPNYVPDDTILQLRELTRFRWGLVDQIGAAKRRLLAVLDQVFPEFADHFGDPFGVSARELLTRGASAADFAAIDLDELTTVLEQASRKRFGRDKAESIAKSAQESLGVPGLEPWPGSWSGRCWARLPTWRRKSQMWTPWSPSCWGGSSNT